MANVLAMFIAVAIGHGVKANPLGVSLWCYHLRRDVTATAAATAMVTVTSLSCMGSARFG
jgi:hypothetical protein